MQGWPYWWVLQRLVAVQVKAEYTLGQWRGLLAVGISWHGQWAFRLSLLLPFHYPPQSTLGRLLLSYPMDRQQYQCLRNQNFLPVAAIDTAPPPWFHLGTFPIDSLPLDDQAAGQDLKLNNASCQFSYPFHFEAHRIFSPRSSP